MAAVVVANHVVRYGQTLSGIAAYYGTTTSCLAQVNGIWNPNLIFVGQVLTNCLLLANP